MTRTDSPYGSEGHVNQGRAKFGKARIFPAMGWALKRPFTNQGTWIGGELLTFLLYLALSLIGAVVLGMAIDNPLTSGAPNDAMAWKDSLNEGLSFIDDHPVPALIGYLIQLFFFVALVHLALRDRDTEAARLRDFGRGVHWGTTAVAVVVSQAVLFGFAYAAGALEDWLPSVMDDGLASLVALAVQILGWVLIPFFWFVEWFAADGASLTDSFRLSLQAGKENWLRLFFLPLLISLFGALFIMVTLGFGILLVFPAYFLFNAYLYRDVTGPAAGSAAAARHDSVAPKLEA
ncbi:hypothetical protein [Corynebacterium massiliense]|uniref:DUF975 family protein n=1 Tax=Corynebacterium massiliense DSM 45435 TaxID=1121364 RepID=A0ABY7U7J9_9CORY|nr:hypothetical protein [Corynebacterium massiliense]WCZ32678.1 hypothetical protein CMASS_06220 [Corynebacterium massiliense DSM 45435]